MRTPRARSAAWTAALRAAAAVGSAILVAASWAPRSASAQETPVAAGAAPTPAGVASRGARLFSGQVRFTNGGPPCGACHAASGLLFPGGGTMGPDLTYSYTKYGQQPLQIVLTTLFFPTMNPIFAGRALTPVERADLLAFFEAAAARPPASGTTLRTFVLGIVVFLFFAAIVAIVGRTRLRGVRAPLVRAAERRLREAGR